MPEEIVLDTVVNAELLKENLNNPNWVVVDCRFSLDDPSFGQTMYANGHVPQARFADLNDDLSSRISETSGRHPLPDPNDFVSRLGSWGISKATQVVAYDQSSGPFAARLWWLLRWMGHRNVAVLDGGLDAWLKAGGVTTHLIPNVVPTVYEGHPSKEAWLTTDELEESLRDGDLLLIDARETKRFRGEYEPIDIVAGHIPGAINLPFKENVGANGTLLGAKELRDRFSAVLQGKDPRRVVQMCGSGVTACCNILAMELAGLGGSRLYAGSWSEWIRDRNRKIEKG